MRYVRERERGFGWGGGGGVGGRGGGRKEGWGDLAEVNARELINLRTNSQLASVVPLSSRLEITVPVGCTLNTNN